MDPNLAQKQPASPAQPTTQPKSSYFTKLFAGRLNRQNYIVGSTFFVLVPLLCFLVVIFNILLSPSAFAMPYLDPNNPSQIITPQISIVSLLETPSNELWSAIGIIFIILSLPYLFSLQIRRLHDLNLNGWLWTVNFLPLLFLKQMFSLTELSHPDTLFLVANGVSLITGVFSTYVTIWPGTKGVNKYGNPPLPRSSFLGDIMELK
jgi:uncharacterized membrane protein YhaH (DUF805 family)